MEEYAIVLMLRDKETGFLEKELGSYKIKAFENLILNIYAEEIDGDCRCFMKLSTDKELEDWAFEAVYDYYDGDVFSDAALSFEEVADCYNPTWEVSFRYDDDPAVMEGRITALLAIHNAELASVYEAIADKRKDYD
ncbi:MAG: hypothetical protein LBU77_06275 [Clostridiales bacterium]|jgi:hypothetical protein|nr:hypothetical protein [Clostridiales bacterium]